jgi:8-oxo-dGTP pyrophosphatase MutT (NUDIX family)
MTRPLQTFQVGVKAFVWHDERLLVVQERAEPRLWELPGGRIEPHELELPLATVLARELREELGAAFRCTIGSPCAAWIRPARPDRPLPVFLVGLSCTAASGAIALSDEHVAWRWLAADAIDDVELVPGYREPVATFLAAR